MRMDLSVVGFAQTLPRRIAAAATRYEVGEPLHGLGVPTNGEVDVNTYVLAAADTPIIGTHNFGGVAISHCEPFSTGTVVAHTAKASCPVPQLGRIRGKALTSGEIDTLSEAVGILGDVTLIDYNATGASDGGEEYTIISNATANTSGLRVEDVDVARGTVDVSVDALAYRSTRA